MDKLFSDEQLIAFFIAGNKEAWNIFFEIYKAHSINLASDAVKKYKGSGISFEEFFSLSLESILTALNKYQLYSCTFYSYFKSIAETKFQNYVKHNALTSKENINPSLSLDENPFEDSKTKYEDIIGVNDSLLDTSLSSLDLFNLIYSKIELLTEKERQFLFLQIDGYDETTIQVLMELSKKELSRIKKSINEKLDVELIKQYFN